MVLVEEEGRREKRVWLRGAEWGEGELKGKTLEEAGLWKSARPIPESV